MNQILPVIIVCAVGIGLCLGYIVFLCVKAVRANPPAKHKQVFEIEEDVLTVKLGRRKKKK